MLKHTNNINKIPNNEILNDIMVDDKTCLICLEQNGIVILCTKCKYKYCHECANKVKKLCTICVRIRKLYSDNYMNSNIDLSDYTYIYENIDDYDIESSHHVSYFFTIVLSILINAVIRFCWVMIILFFGFIGIKFLFNIFSIISNYIVHYFYV